MEHRVRSRFNTQIYEEACEWFVDCRCGDLDDAARREFDRWLRKSPEHLSAYLEIAAIWNEGPSLDPTQKWDADTLIVQAAVADDGNVVPLPGLVPGEVKQPSPRRARRWRLLALAASVAAFAAGGLTWIQFRMPVYSAAVGEHRSITLEDGSTVELNSRSKVRVMYSGHERSVKLLEGQALFRVAKDHTRPFIVSSGAMRVRAVGTQFDVYRKQAETVVTVVEGRVTVLTAPASFSPKTAPADVQVSAPASPADRSVSGELRMEEAFLLSAGEQLTVTSDTARKTQHPNIASATAWTQRQLVFESASLVEVAREFNRYNTRQLIIDDARLHDFHISGVFSSSDSSSLIRFLRERPDVRVIETDSEIRVERK